jgi:primary-amine oxidase
VFQSGLDQTFQVEKRPHPLNSLSAAEISEAVTIVKAAPDFKPNTRFTEISLHEPDKAVWDFALNGTPVDAPRTADVVMLDGKHVIEAVVDLQNKKSSHGRRLKTPTAWCCWMISPACRTSSTPAANSPRC